jgi:hypothetical protein
MSSIVLSTCRAAPAGFLDGFLVALAAAQDVATLSGTKEMSTLYSL